MGENNFHLSEFDWSISGDQFLVHTNSKVQFSLKTSTGQLRRKSRTFYKSPQPIALAAISDAPLLIGREPK